MSERWSSCELSQKQIVNVCDGSNLGCASDFEIDICDGRITALIVSRPSGFLWLCHDCDLIIPWCDIERIGEDTILVKIPPERCRPPEKKKKKHFGD